MYSTARKLVAMMGWRDIEFESNPPFSKSYFLRGKDETAIRLLFRSEVLSYFGQNPRLWIEGEKDTLIYHRNNELVEL